MVVCVGMKLQCELIDLQVDGHGIVGCDLDAPVRHAHADVFRFHRDVKLLSLLEDVGADVVRALFRVSRERETGFGFDRILELVVFDVDGHDFDSRESHRPEDDQREQEAHLRATMFARLKRPSH
jgi:hypothetical protein